MTTTAHRPTLRRLAAVAALGAVLALAPAAGAQEDANVQRGFAAEKVYAFGEIDTVNLFNGNLVLTIPLGGAYPVDGGLSYGLKLVYNSNLWDFSTQSDTLGSYTVAVVSPSFDAGVGWTLSLGRLFDPIQPDNPSAAGAWTFVGEDGGSHELYEELHEGDSADSSAVLYSRDGSYLRLKPSSFDLTNGGFLIGELESPDGTVRRFTRDSGHWSVPFRLASITDPYGNQVTVTYPSSTRWTISDGHRVHHVDFASRWVDQRVVLYVSKVTLAAFGGGTAVYEFTYEDLTFERHPQDTYPHTDATATAPVLRSVELPDGSFWRMPLYFTTASAGPGLIGRLELPTLGKIDWTWRSYKYPSRSDGVGGETLSVTDNYGVATKRVLDAAGSCQTLSGVGCQWTYTPGNDFGSTVTTRTVTHPTGDETVHHFATPFNVDDITWTGWEYGLPFTTAVPDGQGRYLSQEIYDGPAATGVKKRSISVRYEHDRIPADPNTTLIQDWYNTNRRVASEKTVYHDDGGRFAEVTHSQFDGLGHYRRAVTSGSFDAGNARTTHTGFNPASGIYEIDPATNQPTAAHSYAAWSNSSPWVLGTFPETWQSEGGATAKQQYCFESASGFLLRKRVLAGSGPGANDLLTVFTRDAAGNVFREQHYGGDIQALGTGALCALALPGDQYRGDHTYARGARATSRWVDGTGIPLPFFTLQLAIDAASGLPASAWDVSGIRTDYEYDAMGRLTWEKPIAGHGAWTEYAYANAFGSTRASVHVRRRSNGSKSGTMLAQSRFEFDPMGRLASEQQRDAAGVWRAQATTWNAMGWKHTVSETGSSAVTAFESYDPYGRPQRITPPDGSAHAITLAYAGVREVRRTVRYNAGNQLSTTTERYDRQGRLFQVVEPSAPGGANTTTTYGYDVGGRLKAVFMAGGGLSQGRDFVYDHRGLLLRERHPEKGTSGNGWVRYLGYDALGNPGRKIDAVDSPTATSGAEVDLTFTYDRASRLTHQHALGVLSKRFEYGTANGAGDFRLGRLVRATRHNHVSVGTTPFHIPIEETYVYGGPAGAVSARTTQAYHGSTPIEGFTQGWAYDQLGNPATLTYPRCISSGCNGAATTSRTVSFTYSNGWLTSVPGYASAIGYHPNGMVHQVDHANGVTYTQANDPNGMRRPSSYAVTSTATGAALWQSGAYAYDGSGNLTAIGGATYVYDAVSRLVSGTVFTGPFPSASGSHLGQQATYDPFGNLTSLATEVGDCPDRELTDQTVTGTLTETACGRLLAGPSYTVSSTGDLTLRAGRQVVLRNGFSVAAGGRLAIGIDPSLDDGSTQWRSSSQNLESLRSVANSSKQFSLTTSATQAVTTSQGAVPLYSEVPGIFLDQGGESTDSQMSYVLVAAGLTQLEASKSMAHELTHAALFARGEPFQHEPGFMVEVSPGYFEMRGGDGPVNSMTRQAEREAEANSTLINSVLSVAILALVGCAEQDEFSHSDSVIGTNLKPIETSDTNPFIRPLWETQVQAKTQGDWSQCLRVELRMHDMEVGDAGEGDLRLRNGCDVSLAVLLAPIETRVRLQKRDHFPFEMGGIDQLYALAYVFRREIGYDKSMFLGDGGLEVRRPPQYVVVPAEDEEEVRIVGAGALDLPPDEYGIVIHTLVIPADSGRKTGILDLRHSVERYEQDAPTGRVLRIPADAFRASGVDYFRVAPTKN